MSPDPRFAPPPDWSVRGRRMTLRLLSAEDRAEFVRVHEVSWALFRPWFPEQPPGQTWDDLFDRMLAKAQAGVESGTEYRLVGRLEDERRVAGFFNLVQVVRGAAWSAVASWAVSADVARQGYGTEGVGALLDFAFAPLPDRGLGLHRVQASVIPANAASLRVAEKNGFRREGLGVRMLNIAGQWRDHVLFAKLADEHGPLRGNDE